MAQLHLHSLSFLTPNRFIPAFSLVVPAYNEEGAIEATVDELQQHLADAGLEYEIIVVNDGSTHAWPSFPEDLQGLRHLAHHENRGKGAALETGMRAAAEVMMYSIDKMLGKFKKVVVVVSRGNHNPDAAVAVQIF